MKNHIKKEKNPEVKYFELKNEENVEFKIKSLMDKKQKEEDEKIRK